MRLIDLDEIRKYPIRLNTYDKEHGDKNFVLGVESLMEFIESLPEVDAEIVTRCKDCEKFNTFSCPMRGFSKEHDYCSFSDMGGKL